VAYLLTFRIDLLPLASQTPPPLKAIFKNKYVEVIVEVTLLIFSSYLLIQRISGFSLATEAAQIFHSQFLTWVTPKAKAVVASIFFIMIFFKIVYLIRDKIQSKKFNNEDPSNFMEVIALFQRATSDLITKIFSSSCCCRAKIDDRKQFVALLQGVSKNLVEFTATGFGKFKFKRRDIFISVYEYINTEKGDALTHLFHEDAKRYDISSKTMLLNGEEHKDYECIRALKDDRNMTVKLSAKDLRIPGRKRHKTMTHYIGAPLKVSGETVGFLNLEFHRETYFSKEEELEEFAQNCFLPFQMLLEQAFGKWHLTRAIEAKCGCNNNQNQLP